MNISDRLTLITDEISQDFEKVLKIAQNFDISNVEVRGVWKKNIATFSDEDLKRMQRLLEEYSIGISMVSGPFGKCVLPDSKFAKPGKQDFNRDPDYNLGFFDRLVHIAKTLGTKNMRIFNFYKMGTKNLENPLEIANELLTPYVKKAEEQDIVLMLENEHVCFADTISNTLKTFESIKSDSLKLNLDPGNYFSAKEGITPADYEKFYKDNLIGYMHVKDPKMRIPILGSRFGVVGEGKISYPELFAQAINNGYKGFFSLETHCLINKEETSLKSLKNMSEMLHSL